MIRPGRRFVSVRIKLAIAGATLLTVVAATVFVGLRHFEREQLLLGKEQAARMSGELFLRVAATPVVFDDATGIYDTVVLLGRDRDVLAVELRAVAGGHQIGRQIGWTGKDATVPSLPIAWTERVTLDRLPDRIVLQGPVRGQDDEVIAVAAIQFSLAPENAALAALELRLLVTAVASAALLGLLLTAVTRYTVTGPLARLFRAVKQVERGQRADLDVATTHDEVGLLGEAFRGMADTVERRERDIAHRNLEMRRVLDNVGQGFLMLDPDGRIASERSAIVDRWFGTPETDGLIEDYLRPLDADVAERLALGLATLRAGVMPLAVCVSQLPRSMRLDDRHYACEYHAVASGESLEQLLLVISDVTSEVERERAESAQHDVMAAVARLLRDKRGYLDFETEADALVDRIAGARPDETSVAEIMRDLHTLKGSCAVFGLNGIAGFCHALEERLLEDGGLPAEADGARLREMWSVLRGKIAIFTGGEPTTVEISREEYRDLAGRLEARAPHGQLLAMVRRWVDDPVLPRLRHLGDHAALLARRLGRCRVTVDFGDTGNLRLPHEPWSRLWPCLAHVIRNAVDHGLETEAERIASGKPAVARLLISARQTDEGLFVAVADDGRGLDWERVRDRAAALGLPSDRREDPMAALFADGLSTRDSASETSGRGVGLAAVLQVVDALGGDIAVDSGRGRGTWFVFRFPATPIEIAKKEIA